MTKPISAGLLALAMAPLAFAAGPQPRTALHLLPPEVSAALQQQVGDRYGAAEVDVLRGLLRDSLQRALASAGVDIDDKAGIAATVEIFEARPTHPTAREMQANPGIDFLASRSLGGARVHVVLGAGAGKEPRQFDCGYYAPSLWEISQAAMAWADAQLAFDRCADELVVALQRLSAGQGG